VSRTRSVPVPIDGELDWWRRQYAVLVLVLTGPVLYGKRGNFNTVVGLGLYVDGVVAAEKLHLFGTILVGDVIS